MALNFRTVRLLSFVVTLVLAVIVSPAAASLLVTSDALDIVNDYHETTGALLGTLAPSVNGVGQLGVHLNGAQDRMLVGHFSGGVDEYDANTGAYIKTYNGGGGIGTQWAGIYAPTGGVYIGSWDTNDIREYDATTGAFIRVVTAVNGPADMRIGPNGNLYICGYTTFMVTEVDAVTGAFVDSWSLPFGARANDIEFLPNGEPLVTAMGTNVAYHYDTSYNLLGAFAGTGWARPHGIEISPFDGNIYAIDGVTAQVHVFDPVTFAELDAAFLTPSSQNKIVDLTFRTIPEPASLGMVLAALLLIRRRSSAS